MRCLEGKTIAITRAKEDRCILSEKLTELGANTINIPCIEKRSMLNADSCRALLQIIKAYRWVVFTSPYAVKVLFDNFDRGQTFSEYFSDVKIASVGPATVRALSNHNVHTDFMPTPHLAESLPAGMGNLTNQGVLLPRSKKGDPALVTQFRKAGAQVKEVWTYDTLLRTPGMVELGQAESSQYIVFTSGTSVRGFAEGLKTFGQPAVAKDQTIVCIGPSTASVSKKYLQRVDLTANPHTQDGIIKSIVKHTQIGV